MFTFIACGIMFVTLFILFILSPWLFPEWWGSHSLGNNIYLLDWDNNSELIVWGGDKEGYACFSGALLIPNEKNSNTERIISVETNEDSIFVKTSIDNRKKYYIIDLNFDKNKIDLDDVVKYHIKEVPDSIWLIKKNGAVLDWKR